MLSTSTNHLNLYAQSSPSTEFRVWRRRRLKFHHKTHTFSCQLGPVNPPLLENFFQNFLSKCSSINSLKKSNRNNEISDSEGERVLFTSPTPFNRFVLLRCPSIVFKEDLNGRILKEDRHFVKRINGKIEKLGENLVYQRSCVGTGDGGMISLDWPAKLDLMNEQGIDTTVLLVPGNAEGSMDMNIRSFVCELLKHGCFPVVMNPRGCAGSPLTTPRLFTAADSDDVCTAIQFINKARPGNTLMSVSWGHGANMLTKYLAEVSEKTPLTAATCIDNPFDLEEATRSFPYHVAMDQKLTSGLIDILQSNKELFQGRPKRYNMEKALSATSLRDFDREISMISYGLESIEEFYSKCSTRELVGNVKIPLLFIQSDDGTVPPFSIPRGAIAENSYTSLLLCSDLPSGNNVNERSVLPWCQDFAIEWLTAVELGLLKGRHPLLTDVDFTINPSAGLALVEDREHSGVNKLSNATETDATNGYHLNPIENDTRNAGGPVPQPREFGEKSEDSGVDDDMLVSETAENAAEMDKSQVVQSAEAVQKSEENGLDDGMLVSETTENPEEVEKSQVLQSAEAVLKMLDSSMPGVLEEEQKMKVLTALEQGDTLMKALEGYVPEDVRMQLTANVTSKLQETFTSKIQETFTGLSMGTDDVRSVEQLVDEIPGGTDGEEPSVEEPESNSIPSENASEESQVQSESSESKEASEGSRKKEVKSPGCDEIGSEIANDSTVEEKEKVNSDMDIADVQKSSSATKMEEKSPKVEDKSKEQVATDSEETEPPVDVIKAVDTVTGLKDDPQAAIKNVLGAVEDVAAKLEEDGAQETDGNQTEAKDASEESPPP